MADVEVVTAAKGIEEAPKGVEVKKLTTEQLTYLKFLLGSISRNKKKLEELQAEIAKLHNLRSFVEEKIAQLDSALEVHLEFVYAMNKVEREHYNLNSSTGEFETIVVE